jgi:hypothetical protein
MELLTRHELAKRWKTHTRTIDRKRQAGEIPWIDLSGGRGCRPIVRFRLDDVQQFEKQVRQDISQS